MYGLKAKTFKNVAEMFCFTRNAKAFVVAFGLLSRLRLLRRNCMQERGGACVVWPSHFRQI